MNDDNIKWIDIGEKLTKELLKRKQQEYGDFDGNSYIVSNFIKSTLEVINKKKIKVPLTIVPQLMIVLKLTRTIQDGSKKNIYKEDTHKDIAGYNHLLKLMVQGMEINNNEKQE